MKKAERYIAAFSVGGIPATALVVYLVPAQPAILRILLGLNYLSLVALGVGLLATIEYTKPQTLPIRQRLLMLLSLMLAAGLLCAAIWITLIFATPYPGQRHPPVRSSPADNAP